ncbi:MAG: MFS transporter [Armatimonadetes bacterium]|nr:MAG: MFS transporter [Armatimonadota bacterium]
MPDRYPRGTVVAIAAFVFIAFGVELYAMSVLLTEDAAGGEFSISLLSLAFGGSVVIAGLVAPRVGRWADHHAVRGLMILGAVLAFLALSIVSLTNIGWIVVLSFWVLLGPAQAMTLYEPAFVAVGLWVGANKRNHAIALLVVIGGLAGPVFLPLTGYAVEHFGWRQTTFAYGVAILVAALIVSIGFLPRDKPSTDRPEPPRPVKWRRFVEDRRLGLQTLAVVLLFASVNSMLFHRVAVFEEQGFDVALVALLAGISGVLTFPGRYVAPRLAHHVAATTILTWTVVGVAGAMVFAIIGTPTAVMVAHFVIFGIFFGFTLPLRPVIMNDWFAGEDFGSVMGKQWSAAAVAGGVAPTLIGVGRDAFGSYLWPLVALTAAFVLAAIFNELSVSRFARRSEPAA